MYVYVHETDNSSGCCDNWVPVYSETGHQGQSLTFLLQLSARLTKIKILVAPKKNI
jgi:hypothetical protein